MAGLMDFLQSASNSAASNVSAPVDGLAWLLRKAGVPMPQNPLLGSDWMAEKGLTKPVVQSGASLMGETAGMLAPFLAAAKAPQIAKGLLQGADNLAAPRAMNPQTGAVVWHGSPHKFDKFDSSKIGTGEGNQSYGNGLYLADSPDVAKGYADNVKDMGAVKKINAELSQVADIMGKDAIPGAWRKYRTDAGAKAAQRYDELMAARSGVSNAPGTMYKVDLPDEHIAKMLDWDKPLSAQSAGVQEAIRKIRPGIDNFSSPVNGKLQKAMDQSGEDFVEWMGRGHDYRLRENGIPGIRYLDGGSRTTGGTSNYVVFPGNEGLLSIMERNGQALK